MNFEKPYNSASCSNDIMIESGRRCSIIASGGTYKAHYLPLMKFALQGQLANQYWRNVHGFDETELNASFLLDAALMESAITRKMYSHDQAIMATTVTLGCFFLLQSNGPSFPM